MRVVTYYIEVVGTLALEGATLAERSVQVCKELEGIAASAEALDGEHHVPDAFFPLPPSHSHCAYLVLLPFTHSYCGRFLQSDSQVEGTSIMPACKECGETVLRFVLHVRAYRPPGPMNSRYWRVWYCGVFGQFVRFLHAPSMSLDRSTTNAA